MTLRHKGTERNWRIVGLTIEGFVKVELLEHTPGVGCRGDIHIDAGAEEYHGLTYLLPRERAIVAKAVTRAGNLKPGYRRHRGQR